MRTLALTRMHARTQDMGMQKAHPFLHLAIRSVIMIRITMNHITGNKNT